MQEAAWNCPDVKAGMSQLLHLRTAVNGLLEQARNDKSVCIVRSESIPRNH